MRSAEGLDASNTACSSHLLQAEACHYTKSACTTDWKTGAGTNAGNGHLLETNVVNYYVATQGGLPSPQLAAVIRLTVLSDHCIVVSGF